MGGSRVLLWVAIVVVALAFLYSVRSILFPFVFGLFAAALLDPSIRKLRLRGFSRAGAVWLMAITFFAAVGGAVALLGPRAWAEVIELQSKATEYVRTEVMPGQVVRFLRDPDVQLELADMGIPADTASFVAWLRSPLPADREQHGAFFALMSDELRARELPTTRSAMLAQIDELTQPSMLDRFLADNRDLLERLNLPTTPEEADQQFGIMARVEAASNEIVHGAFGGAAAIAQFLFSSIFLVLITPVVTLFILFDYDNFRRRFVTWIPPPLRPSATELLSDIGEVLGGYLRGLTKSILLYSFIMIVLLMLLGIPYAVFLGLLFGVFYLIPYIGNWLSAIVLILAVLMTGKSGALLMDFGSPLAFGLFASFFLLIVVGTLYDIFGHPRIIGRSIGLPPVVSFFVIFAGAALFGLAGMILAFPIAGLVKVVLDRLIRYTTTTTEPTDVPRTPPRHAS